MDTNGTIDVLAPKLGGGTVTLKKLSPSDFVVLAKQIASERREAIMRNAKDSGIDPKEAFRILNEFDSRPVTRGDVVDAAQQPSVQQEIIRRAAQKQDVSEVDQLQLDLSDAYRITLALLHIDVKPVKAGERPLEPATSGSGTE